MSTRSNRSYCPRFVSLSKMRLVRWPSKAVAWTSHWKRRPWKAIVRAQPNCFPLLALLVLFAVMLGCSEPIYEPVAIELASSDLALASTHHESHYDWPQTRDGYVVAKPPQMAYVTSFTEKLTRPDPVAAELVPWSTDGLTEEMIQVLDEAYKPASLELDVTLSLNDSQFLGPQAFDVSDDATRLVVIDREGLTLYKTEDGSLIGRMKLPTQIASSTSPVEAVRFGGSSMDMLIASAEKIYQISSKDGSVISETKGCGEPIAQWDVNHDDKTMLIRTVSGKLFGGDPQLEYFSKYNLPKSISFDEASLSPDGFRIGVVVDGKPKTYIQDDFHIVDEVDYPQVTLDENVSIALGFSSDAWVDGDGVFYTAPNDNGGRDTFVYHMFWKPLKISMSTYSEGTNSYLVVGSRYVDGEEQLVMFELGVISRSNSLPKRLDEIPIRYAHSRHGDQVAILDSKGLRLCKREVWHSEGTQMLPSKVYGWADQNKFAEIEKLISIIKTQDRLGYGRTSEELRTQIIESLVARWKYLAKNDPDGEYLKGFEEWYKEGSPLAMVVNALRHYGQGWEVRGSGHSGTVSQAGWSDFEKHLKAAAADLDKVIGLGNPPLTALDHRVQVGLEQGADLGDIDKYCKLACELYPGEADPHSSIMWKLTPQWFGEPGDVLSFALSVSKMLEGRESDCLYARLVGDACRYVHWQDKFEWNSYDPIRIRRGVEEIIRRRSLSYHDLWMLWRQIVLRTGDAEMAEMILAHIMENRAAPPRRMTHGDYAYTVDRIHPMAERIRSR